MCCTVAGCLNWGCHDARVLVAESKTIVDRDTPTYNQTIKVADVSFKKQHRYHSKIIFTFNIWLIVELALVMCDLFFF